MDASPVPKHELGDRENIALSGRIALCSYKGEWSQRHKLKTEIEEHGGKLYEFEERNAFGIVIVCSGNIYIGIAGTDDARDAAQDFAVLSQGLSESRLRPSEDAKAVRTTGGFLAHTEQARDGLDQLDIWQDSYANIFIIGHSLGGAIAYLLACTNPFATAQLYLYVPARPLRKLSYSPERSCVIVRHIADPVSWMPPQCKLPSARTYWKTTSFTPPRSHIPLSYKPLAWSYALLFLATGLFASILKMCGVKTRHGVEKGHTDLMLAEYRK